MKLKLWVKYLQWKILPWHSRFHSKRPVVEDSYDYAITVVLKDMEAHDHYQVDPIHLEFIDKCKDYGNGSLFTTQTKRLII